MPKMTAPRSPDSSPLFDDLELAAVPVQPSGVIRFVGHEDSLRKEEKAFNRLTARIKNLQVRIERAERENLELDQYYIGQFSPALETLGQAMMTLALKLEESAARQVLTKATTRLLKRLMPDLLQEAFQITDPTSEALALHDKYSRRSYQTIQEEEEAAEGEALRDFMEALGFELPPEIRENLNDPDFMDAFADRIAQQFTEDLSPGAKPAPRPRKKSKKQLEREAREQRKDELKQRSLRDIFLALAKVLHPDVEIDPEKKHQKEAFLKRVTSAYSAGNLMELLHLEMEWLDEGGFQGASTDKLVLYIELLKDQVKDLEATCFRMENKFRDTYSSVSSSIGTFRRALVAEKIEMEIEAGRLKRFTSHLEREPVFLNACLETLRKGFQTAR